MCLPQKINHPACVLHEGEHSGHEFAVTFNDLGYRCGYVKVEPGHPWHGCCSEDIDARVHGGLTFTAPDVPCEAEGADEGWWLGFDCGHGWDVPDLSLPLSSSTRRMYERLRVAFGDANALMSGEARSTEYVIDECRHLAEQAREAAERAPARAVRHA